jgi:hypothetical protein
MPGRGSSSVGRRGRAIGSPEARHASKPPIMSPVATNPRSTAIAAARLDEKPWAHRRMRRSAAAMAGFRHGLVGSMRHSKTERGMCSDPGTIPSRSRAWSVRRSMMRPPAFAAISASDGSNRTIRRLASVNSSSIVRRTGCLLPISAVLLRAALRGRGVLVVERDATQRPRRSRSWRDWRRATSSSVCSASASWRQKRSGAARRTPATFDRFTR